MFFVLRALLTAFACLALLAYPAWAWGQHEGLVALGVAIAVCFAGSLVGHLPFHFFRKQGPEGVANAVMAGLGLRMLTTGALAVAIDTATSLPQTQFMTWIAIGYLAFLALEVFVSVRTLRTHDVAAASTNESPATNASTSTSRSNPHPGETIA